MDCFRFAFLLLTALAYGASPASSQSSSGSCVEGQSWFDGCNNCFCSNGNAVCTLKLCFDSPAPPAPNPDSSSCVDGSTWQQDCNTCQCFGGAPICTLRACGGFGFRRSKSLARSSPPNECEVTDPDTDRWRKSCNWCRCLNGRGVCDRKGCPPDFDARNSGTPECEGKARWKKDCNWCDCENGVGICTRMACFNRADIPALNKQPRIEAADTKECEVTDSEAGRWWKECNGCRCVEGKEVCTRRGCPPDFAARYPDAPQCEGSARWKRNGIWCSCVNDKAVCGDATGDSRKSEDSLENKECTSGSIWNDGCNKCVCLETGIALCTRRACPPNHYAATSIACKENSRWRKGCNTCTCAFGVGVCTARACATRSTLQAEESPVSAVTTRITTSVSSPSSNNQEAVKDYTCSDGSRWLFDACNWCDCEGGKAVCTSNECTSDNSEPSEFTCITGSTWHDGCNGCVCSNGRSACTLKLCSVQVSRVPTETAESDIVEEESSIPEESKCIDGTSWFDGCNNCHCHRGFAACTKKLCVHLTPVSNDFLNSDADLTELEEPLSTKSILNPIDNRDCVPGSRYKLDECNWCSCSDTGRGVCTLRACFRRPGTESQIGKCEEGSRWKKDSCNWCNCVNGFGVCTAMACFSDLINRPVPMIAAEVPEEPSLAESEMCLAGSHFRKDCNWCTCNNGRISCTKRRCRPEPLQRSPDCSGVSVWREECNICVCNEAGFASCTRKLCSVRRQTTSSPVVARPVLAVLTRTRPTSTNIQDSEEKECNPGSRWKVDCNTCSCTNTGISRCTRMICQHDDVIDDEQECLTGSYFRAEDGCNWCSCYNGAKACTAKACSVSRPRPAAAVLTSITNKPTERVEKECEPGTTWQEECNTCACNGGKSYCTVRACFSMIRDIRPVSARRRCNAPAVTGTCRAGFKMFTFNSERNRCEMFLYGGCGGNDNRFATAEECQQTCGGEAPVIDSSCDRNKCELKRQDAFMASKNCKPLYEGGSCCATSYACSDEALPKKSCIGPSGEELIDDPEMLHSIGESQYYCRGGVLKCHYPETQCSYDNIIEKNCRSTFSEDRCCASGYACYYEEDVPLCKANGKDYYEGNKIFFEGTDSSQVCLCTANYTGPYGEGCKTIDCNYDTISATQVEKGCVPFFANNNWCPDGFLCPGASVLDVDQSDSNPEGLTEDVCTFAGVTIARGRQLAISDGSLNCSCQTPPMITCTRNYSGIN